MLMKIWSSMSLLWQHVFKVADLCGSSGNVGLTEDSEFLKFKGLQEDLGSRVFSTRYGSQSLVEPNKSWFFEDRFLSK